MAASRMVHSEDALNKTFRAEEQFTKPAGLAYILQDFKTRTL
jgi:hypothetical protein